MYFLASKCSSKWLNNFAFLLLIIIVLNFRKSFEFEDASSLQSLYPPSPTENGTESQHKFGSKSTLEENAYEDIVGKKLLQNTGSQQDAEWLWAGCVLLNTCPVQEHSVLSVKGD